jgi:hypothetical protein
MSRVRLNEKDAEHVPLFAMTLVAEDLESFLGRMSPRVSGRYSACCFRLFTNCQPH